MKTNATSTEKAGATNWKEFRLGELVTIKYGKGLATKELKQQGFPVFGANGIIGCYDSFMYEEEQVLISCRGAYSGKINWSPKQSFITNNSLILEIADQQLITKKYLFFSLTNVDKSNLITGSAQPQVTINNAVDLPIPLPPLHMQQRIVAEIEKQFSRLDEAVTNLKRVKANLKRYRASVLKAAVEGRLVETEAEVARREGREYESGKQLLERILETRRRDWKGKGQYKEPAAPDVSKLPELPEGWAWGTVEQMADKITDGEHISPKTLPAGVPMLSAKDVRENEILFEEPKYVSPAEAKKFRERCDPCRDDILIVSRGATVGRACKVTTDQLFCLMGSVILLRITKLCLAEFVLCSLKAGFFLKRLIGVSGSTAQQAVYIRDIRALILPLPPLAEQKRIVAEVDRRLSLVRETEAQVEANLKRAERLRQSVLQKAFSGELVRDEAG